MDQEALGLCIRNLDVRSQALLTGGGQEKGERSTTENLPGIVATTKALRMALEEESVTENFVVNYGKS